MASRKLKGDYDGKIAGLYDLGDTIGRGHFAVVKLARHVFTGERVAVKVIDKTKLDDVSKTHLFQEVRCMKLVQHPNVVRLYEVIDTQTKLYLILELGDGGDMYDYIMKQDRGIAENTSRKYFRQIVEAISYCHQLHVVHRDLKPENVVFFEKLGIVKLTDFGFSNMFNPGKKLETSCGSLAYSAPEILLGDSYDAPAVDVWSLGVILYMLVCGHAPFQEANDSETLTKIMDCKYKVSLHVSPDCIQLISRMLVREPGHRASLNDIMNHTWLKGVEPLPPVYTPLISRETVSEEDHNHVLHRMIDGNIASKEEIQHSLEKDNYDHVAATYYLLLERRLKKARQDMMQSAAALYQLRRQSNGSQANKPHLEPLALSPRKHRELKKTKTAPLSTTDCLMPVASPLEAAGSADSNPFMKSLTMSMTLDRRKRQQSLGITPVTMTSPLQMRKQVATGQTTSIQTDNKHLKKKSDSFSKIAILSSFFERKAAVASGKVPPPDLRAGFFKKHRTPGNNVQPRDSSHGSGGESIIQSLVSPPGARLSGAGQHLSGSQEKLYRMRKCSLIQEESLEEEDYEEEMDTDLKSVRSLDDLDESLLPEPSSTDSVSSRRSLHTVASSPQLLNQIHEEHESDEEDDIVPHKIHAPRTLISRNNTTSPDMLGKYEQRKKRRGAGQRGTSCSSSDASDTDDTEGRSRKDKLKHKILHRRDSSDHSSDNDGGGGPAGHGQSGGGQRFNGGDNNGSGGGRGNPDNDRKDQGGKDASDGKGSRGSYNSKQNSGMSTRMANMSNDSNSKLGGLFTRRISELSVASTISSLSLTSVTSKNSLKYMVDMEDIRTGSKRNSLQEEIDRLNMVNARLIEVKEFVDITDFQSQANKSSSGGSVCSSDCNLSHRKGRSPRIKTDINSNGLKPEHLSHNGSQTHLTTVKETRCCSLI